MCLLFLKVVGSINPYYQKLFKITVFFTLFGHYFVYAYVQHLVYVEHFQFHFCLLSIFCKASSSNRCTYVTVQLTKLSC